MPTLFMHVYLLIFFLDVQFVFGSRLFFGVQHVGRPNLFFWTPNFFGRPKKVTSTIFAGRPFFGCPFFLLVVQTFFWRAFLGTSNIFLGRPNKFLGRPKKSLDIKKIWMSVFRTSNFLGWGRPKIFGASEKKNWTSKT